MTNPIMIEARDLSKFYGPFVAVENVRFAIPRGQIVAFLGPNGAGKTTTMKMLTGYLAPSAGTAEIAGLDVHQQRPRSHPPARLPAGKWPALPGHDAGGVAPVLRGGARNGAGGPAWPDQGSGRALRAR